MNIKLKKELQKNTDEITILFGLNECKIISNYPKKLDKILVAPYPNYWFSPKYKQGYWDGKYKFIKNNSTFPTGLLPILYKILVTGVDILNKEEPKVFSPKKVKIKVPNKYKKYFNINFVKQLVMTESIEVIEKGVYIPTPNVKNMLKNVNKENKDFIEFFINFLP